MPPAPGWMQDLWGNYLADLYARSPVSPPLNFLSLVVLPTFSHTAFAQAAIRPQNWYFVANGQATLLDGLGSALAHASILDYLSTRHASCATRGVPARWAGTSVALAEAWKLSQRGIAKRGGKVRHLWDLRWHGANQAIANPGLADVLGVCPLCGPGSCKPTISVLNFDNFFIFNSCSFFSFFLKFSSLS